MRLALVVTAAVLAAGLSIPAAAQPEARIETSLGTIVVLLEGDKAPATVANFIRYAKQGHFNNTVIYRIVPGFVVQTGSMKPDGTWKPAGKPIPLETATGLSNKRGTLAMARDDKPASATAEFFINLADTNAQRSTPKPAVPPTPPGMPYSARSRPGWRWWTPSLQCRSAAAKASSPPIIPKRRS